jgi:uncharacterized protein YkwD
VGHRKHTFPIPNRILIPLGVWILSILLFLGLVRFIGNTNHLLDLLTLGIIFVGAVAFLIVAIEIYKSLSDWARIGLGVFCCLFIIVIRINLWQSGNLLGFAKIQPHFAVLLPLLVTPTPTPTLTPEQFREEVIILTNKYRQEQHLKPLTENKLLNQSATLKGQDMIARNYWSHDAPDGTKPWAFFTKVGFLYTYVGENLARDFATPQDAVTSWINSPSHKENLISPKFSQIGVAVLYHADSHYFQYPLVVQHLGAPLPQAQNYSPQVATTPSRTGEIIPYHEWCGNREIKIYRNELITQNSSDGSTYSMTKGDWDCYEKYLQTKR